MNELKDREMKETMEKEGREKVKRASERGEWKREKESSALLYMGC